MLTLDLKRKYKVLFNPTPKQVTVVEVPPLQYLMLDGSGNPNTSQVYQDAVEALYGLAYTLKFMLKKAPTSPVDYPVMALEGLWWADDMNTFSVERKDDWLWTMMIMQPDVVTPERVERAREQAIAKKGDSPALRQVRLETFNEGLCAQIMHIGPYAAEAPTMEKLHGYIHANGYQLRGKHHEIYLSDPRKSAPERMKTVLRQPISRR
jgi:hypothetical protein